MIGLEDTGPTAGVELTIILPRYREGLEIIIATLCRLRPLRASRRVEIIIVNDGGPIDVMQAVQRRYPDVSIVNNLTNYGKGRSIANAVRHARGRRILYSDIDLPIEVGEIGKAWRSLEESEAGLFTGVRHASLEARSNIYRRLTSTAFRRIVGALLTRRVTDTQCPFKMIDARLARALFPLLSTPGYAFDAELLYLATLQGVDITQDAVSWNDTRAPWGPVKTGWIFLRMVASIIRIRLHWQVFRGRLSSPRPTAAEPAYA